MFRVFAGQILANQDRYGKTIRWYIMTSPANDAPTRAFIQDNRCFGLDRRNIFMFPQGTTPSIEVETGNLLLADKGRVAVNPDGHGGSIKALVASGAIDAMLARDLLAALRTGTCLLLVGDEDQLPSVGPGNVLSDVIASGAMGWFGPAGLFLYIALVLVVFGGFIFHRMGRRAGVAADRKSSFVPVTRNSPAATLLDPRAPWEKRLDPERQKMERMLDESRWR